MPHGSVVGVPERQLGEEAADPADRRRDGDRQDVRVARRPAVPEGAFGEHDRDVPAGECAEDALAAVLDGDSVSGTPSRCA